jgi:hypothetical protein
MIIFLANLHNSHSQLKGNSVEYKYSKQLMRKNQNKITCILPSFDEGVQFSRLEAYNPFMSSFP